MPRVTARDNPRLGEAARLIASSRDRRKVGELAGSTSEEIRGLEAQAAGKIRKAVGDIKAAAHDAKVAARDMKGPGRK